MAPHDDPSSEPLSECDFQPSRYHQGNVLSSHRGLNGPHDDPYGEPGSSREGVIQGIQGRAARGHGGWLRAGVRAECGRPEDGVSHVSQRVHSHPRPDRQDRPTHRLSSDRVEPLATLFSPWRIRHAWTRTWLITPRPLTDKKEQTPPDSTLRKRPSSSDRG